MDLTEDKNEPMVKPIDFKDFVEHLPVGVYQVDSNGVFVYCNHSMARIFKYSARKELIGMKIIELYYNPDDRERLLEKMRKEKFFLNETLHWKDRQGKKIYLSTSSHFVYDDKGNEIGTRGVLIDGWYERVIDNMNEGIYRIGPDKETFTKANSVIAKMFGFTYPYEIEGQSVRKFYRYPEAMAKFIDTLSTEGKVENYPVEMKKINGDDIVVSANSSNIYDETGKEIGREGTLRDFTEDYKIRKILEEMPTGAYQVKRKDDKEIISYCNNAFAQMLGYSKPEELIGNDINVLHASEDIEKKFKNTLIEADSKGESLLNYRLSVKKKTGEVFWTEIDCQFLKDPKGNIIGRQGTIRDATPKIRLEEMIRSNEDTQRFSHRFMAPITSIKVSADELVEEIEQWIKWKLVDDNKKNLPGNSFALLKTLKDLSKKLAARLEDFIAKHTKEDQNFLAELRRFISKLIEFSDERRLDDIIELRETQRDVRVCLCEYMSLKAGSNIQEEIRDMLNHLGYLDKLYILYIAHTITDTSKIAYTDVENLRSYLSGWNKINEDARYKFRKENLYECIKEVVNIYQRYAFQKESAIEIPGDMLLEIEMSKKDLLIMLHNLIENAVKYSSKKQNIRIQIENLEKNVAIEIVNYGVGILPEEIDTGKIFEHGYRGKLSSDRNRTGSGIGLPEAKKIARKHGGDIIVTSTPVGDVKSDPKVPYITKVKVTLPKFHS